MEKISAINNDTWTLEKYKTNLKVSNRYIYSYQTNVAEIDHVLKEIYIYNWYSQTTSKHINYVAMNYGYKLVDRAKEMPEGYTQRAKKRSLKRRIENGDINHRKKLNSIVLAQITNDIEQGSYSMLSDLIKEIPIDVAFDYIEEEEGGYLDILEEYLDKIDYVEVDPNQVNNKVTGDKK